MTDICEYCGNEYDGEAEGKTHDEDCECYFCDPNAHDADVYYENGEPIREHVGEFGWVNFCCSECEYKFINGVCY